MKQSGPYRTAERYRIMSRQAAWLRLSCVCVDTCSTLGICAERNAIFNMLTNGEQEICKVLTVMSNGKTGAPCGACRELMVQLMPGTYKGIEIMLDYEKNRVVTLGELTPEWWIG